MPHKQILLCTMSITDHLRVKCVVATNKFTVFKISCNH